jgi:hypothetical protein
MYAYQAGKSAIQEVLISFSKIPLWYQLQLSNGREKFIKIELFISVCKYKSYRDCLKSKRYDKGRQAVQRTASPNILVPSVWNWLCVTFLAPRVLRWLLDFWKIPPPMLYKANVRITKSMRGKYPKYKCSYFKFYRHLEKKNPENK